MGLIKDNSWIVTFDVNHFQLVFYNTIFGTVTASLLDSFSRL